MNLYIKDFISSHRLVGIGIDLLDRENTILLLEILKKEDIEVYGFDGFLIIDNTKYQINQNYCRDYSRFSPQERYNLILEYLLKDTSENIYYELSFDKNN